MTEIMEIWYAAETEQLGYRYGEKFSKPRSVPQKKADSELYGEGYYYRNVAREFGIAEDEDLRIISSQGKVLWNS